MRNKKMLKAMEEWKQWVHDYETELQKNLNNRKCQNCHWSPAIIHAHAKGYVVDGKEHEGKDIFLCHDCAEEICKKLDLIESIKKLNCPDISLYGQRFRITFDERYPILSVIIILYFIISGATVFLLIISKYLE